ncbi:MAG: flagellar hook-length control protein FliK [Thermodesulfobacteriota bacterium]
MREVSLLKEKGNDPNGQKGQLANDPVPQMIVASLFSSVFAQKDASLPASFFETQSAQETSVISVESDPKEDQMFPLKQEEKSTDISPSNSERLPPRDLQSNPLPRQNDLFSEIPLPEWSGGRGAVQSELSTSPGPPGMLPRSPSPIEGVALISIPSQEIEPLSQDLVLPQPQGTLTEEGSKLIHVFVAPSLDPSSTEPQLSDLQKPPIETANFTATETARPPERMILGEENHPHRDGAFTVDPSNQAFLIRGAQTSGVEVASSIFQSPPVFSRGRTEQDGVGENSSRDPLPSAENRPVPSQGGANQSLVGKSAYQEPLSDVTPHVRETVFSQDFPTRDSVPKDEKGNLQKEGTSFQHPKAVEALPQKTEKIAFKPEASLNGERRGATDTFEQGVEDRKTELWAKNGEAILSGTKEAESVGPSWMSTGSKSGAELQHQSTKEILEGQEERPPKAEYVEVFQQIAKKVVWSIRNNEEKIKLTLEPPELGHIYMEINREERNIRTTLWADNPTTKGLLEANQIQIYRIFEKEGFHLEKFNVFIHQESESFQERGENSIQYGRWERGKYEEEKGAVSEEPFGINPVINLPYRGSQYIDLFV